MSVVEIIGRELLMIIFLAAAVHCVIALTLLVGWVIKQVWRKVRKWSEN